MIFEDGGFGSWLGYKGRALINRISAFIKETVERSLALSTMWENSKKTAVCQPGSGPSANHKVDPHQTLNLPVPWS